MISWLSARVNPLHLRFSRTVTQFSAAWLSPLMLVSAFLANTVSARVVQAQFQPPQLGPEEIIFPLVITTLPQSDDFVHWETSFALQNISNNNQIVDLRIFQADGAEVNSPSFTRSFEIPPDGLGSLQDVNIFLSTTDPFPFPLINGWARLSPASSNVQAQSEIRLTDNGRTVFTRAYVPGVRPATRFRTFVVYLVPPADQKRQSAYAFVNPSSTQTANVRLTAFFMGSPLVCEAGLTIPPRNQVRKFFSEIFPGCILRTVVNGGRPSPLFVRSDTPIAMAALEFLLPEGRIIALPVAPVQP